MIVEDDPVWMKCISDYIGKENDIIIVKQAYTKEDALEATCFNVDIVLMDLTLSEDDDGLHGLELTNQLYERGLKKIIMLTSWGETEIILKSFDIGAVNYITKPSYRDIPNAIREAYYDKISLHSDVSTLLISELKRERKVRGLTPAEREVYELKEQGLNKVQIAQKLYKSIETIKRQFKKIKSKID